MLNSNIWGARWGLCRLFNPLLLQWGKEKRPANCPGVARGAAIPNPFGFWCFLFQHPLSLLSANRSLEQLEVGNLEGALKGVWGDAYRGKLGL